MSLKARPKHTKQHLTLMNAIALLLLFAHKNKNKKAETRNEKNKTVHKN